MKGTFIALPEPPPAFLRQDSLVRFVLIVNQLDLLSSTSRRIHHKRSNIFKECLEQLPFSL